MKFQISEGVLSILQFVAWFGTAGSALMVLISNLSRERGASFDPTWIGIGVGCVGFAIAATMGRVHIQSLNALEDIRFLLREQSDTRR